MNYINPNLYQNLPYNGNNQYQSGYFNTQAAPATGAPNSLQPIPQIGLNGKIVDTIDMVKATEVPIGGYGIFPKADLNEIYIKVWNPNGTTSITTFKPFVAPEPETQADETTKVITSVLEKMDNLEAKIDLALTNISTSSNKTAEPIPVPARKEF